MTSFIILFVVDSIATIAAWVFYVKIKANESKYDRGSSFFLGLAIMVTFVTYCLFAVTIYEARREVKTSVPAKVELVITEKQESGTVKQSDTVYVYTFQ